MSDLLADPWEDEEDELVEFENGQVLDERFEIRGVLGEGGMGTVYRAFDSKLDREVALKILIPRYRGRPEREARFKREAELCQRAQGVRGIVEYLGAGRLRAPNDCPYIVHGIVHGRPFSPSLDGAMSPRVAATHARLLAETIRGLHRVGIVHRDVTLWNIFIGEHLGETTLELIDLSHAALARPEVDKRLTRVHEIPGTPGFMSPEQAQGQPAEPGMDVYAFGVVLFTMLTARHAFPRLDRMAFIGMQATQALPFPRIDARVHPNIPDALTQLVYDCTAPLPKRVTLNTVVERLDRLLASMVAPLPVESTDVVPAAFLPAPSQPDQETPTAPAGHSAPSVEAPPVAANASDHIADAPRRAPQEAATASPRRRIGLAVGAAAVTAAFLLGWLFFPLESSTAEKSLSSLPSANADVRPAAVSSGDAPEIPKASRADSPRAPKVEPPPTEPAVAKATLPPPRRKANPPKEAPRASAHDVEPAGKAIPRKGPDCETTLEKAQRAASNHAWAELLRLTSRRSCWKDRTQHLRLRTQALFERKLFRKCATLGAGSADYRVKRLAEVCRSRLESSP